MPLIDRSLFILYFLILATLSNFGQDNNPIPISVETDGPFNTKCFSDFSKEKSDLNIALFAPKSLFEVPRHEKLEIGINLPDQVNFDIQQFLQGGEGLNPYLPSDIDCQVTYLSPDNEEITTHGFYYTPYIRDLNSNSWKKDSTSYPFRIRFAPNQEGTWCGTINLKIRTGQEYHTLTKTFSFKCTPSSHKGKLIKNNDQFYYSETGEQFFNIGHTIAHSDYYNLSPKSSLLHLKWIKETGKSGANFLRLELSGRNGLPDFDHSKNYQSRQEEMWEFDQYVETAIDLDMYFTIFRHHIEVLDGEEWDVVKWQNNSYQRDFNLGTRQEYFSDSSVLQSQQNALRYIFSRWGYTPNFAFYGYSEVNNWYKPLIVSENLSEKEAETIFSKWVNKQFQFIQSQTYWAGTGFACGYTGSFPYQKLKASKTIPLCDFVALHHYGESKQSNFHHRYDYVENVKKGFPNTPIQIQEIGVAGVDIYCCTGVDFHNTIWSTAFMDMMGIGIHWWWDRGINDKDYFIDYAPMSRFFEKHKDIWQGEVTTSKWSNSPNNGMNKASIESYYLINQDKSQCIGWVHNAAYYWRNAVKDSACINDLIADLALNENHKCKLEDGMVLGNGSPFGYNSKSYEDHFTNHPEDISNSFFGNSFIISNLNNNFNQVYNPWAKRHQYQVDFYLSNPKSFDKPVHSSIVTSNAIGKIEVTIPNIPSEYQDFLIVVSYLGKRR